MWRQDNISIWCWQWHQTCYESCIPNKAVLQLFGSRYLGLLFSLGIEAYRGCKRFSLLSMLQVSTLASGRSEILSILQSSKVQDLRILAQKSLGPGFLKLATAWGQVLTDHGQNLWTAQAFFRWRPPHDNCTPSKTCHNTGTGWWFQTFFNFHNIWVVILPID